MPVRLLLDVHVSPAVAAALKRRGCDVTSAAEDPALARLDDAALLAEATRQRRAVVTYDIRDFTLLSREWAMSERRHWGIILIHARTIPSKDMGGQLKALQRLLEDAPKDDALRSLTFFLERVES
ncbi:MAG: DUF5615 family PIN-like protein [Armatimonadota bacterium]